jgi:hypothetical protein
MVRRFSKSEVEKRMGLNMQDKPITRVEDLEKIVPMELKKYEDASLAALTSYSLYWLHKWELRRTIEAVSVLNWRLFPEKFSMVGFLQYPDAFRTNRSLLQGQPKYRNYLTGSAKHGFSLNARGMAVAEDLIKQFGPPKLDSGDIVPIPEFRSGHSKSSAPARSIEPEREIQGARVSRLFQKWKDRTMGERDIIHVHALLAIFDHTPTQIRERRMRDLERSAKQIKDGEMDKFLEDVRTNFPSVFQKKE